MLQGISSDNNASSATTGFTSRLRSMTPRNKVLISSAVLIAFLTSVIALAANDTSQYESTQPTTQLTTESSTGSTINVEGIANEIIPNPIPSETKVEARVDVQSSNNPNASSASPSVELEVNGQNIPVPDSGEVNEVITNNEDDGNVQVNVQSNFSQSGSRDRTRIEIDSESESEVRIRSRN